jgi:hypothetical protein
MGVHKVRARGHANAGETAETAATKEVTAETEDAKTAVTEDAKTATEVTEDAKDAIAARAEAIKVTAVAATNDPAPTATPDEAEMTGRTTVEHSHKSDRERQTPLKRTQEWRLRRLKTSPPPCTA